MNVYPILCYLYLFDSLTACGLKMYRTYFSYFHDSSIKEKTDDDKLILSSLPLEEQEQILQLLLAKIHCNAEI